MLPLGVRFVYINFNVFLLIKYQLASDLQDLVDKNILNPEGAGRSVRYELNM